MKQRTTLLLLGILLCCQINACGQMTYEEKLQQLYKNTVPLIEGEVLLKTMPTGDADHSASTLYILDTRAPKEYAISHIPGALLVDYDNFKTKDVKHIPKDAKVIVYCSVGYRSERIGEKLLKMGYQDVKNLYGGIFQWVNEGHQVVNPSLAPTDSVHTYNKNWSQWLKKGVKVYE